MTYSHATNLSIKKLHHPRPSSSFAAATFRPIVRSLAVINSWVMILGGNFHNIYLISLPISIYFNPNHHGHQSWGLILIKQGSLDGKGWFEWRKLFRVPFVDGGSKCTLLGEAMSVDAFLRTVRTGDTMDTFGRIYYFKHENWVCASWGPWCFDSSRCHWNDPCSDEKFAQSFVSKEARVGSAGWWKFVVCTDVSFRIYKQIYIFPQRDATGVCDMWDSLLGEGTLSANC